MELLALAAWCFWQRRADLDGSEGVTFFDGDMRDVLEPDDPRIVVALEREQAQLDCDRIVASGDES